MESFKACSTCLTFTLKGRGTGEDALQSAFSGEHAVCTVLIILVYDMIILVLECFHDSFLLTEVSQCG
jgi:hypothetical protein